MKYVTPILIWLPRPACRIFAFILFTFSPFSFFLQLFYLCMWIIIELFSFQYFQRFHDVRFVTFDSCCCVQFQALLCVSSFFSAAFQCCCVWVRFGMFMFACISHTMLNTNRQSKYNTFPWCCPNAMLSTTCTNIFVYVCVCVCDNSQLMTIINKTSKCVKGVSVRLVGVLRNRERKKPENKLDWCLMYAYFML